MSCYHCGQSIPEHVELTAFVLGEDRAMCCPGCQAVANAIVASGAESFYEYRTDTNETPEFTVQALPDALEQELQLYDNLDVLNDLAPENRTGLRSMTFIVEGITCAACSWLIEKQLRQQAGVTTATLNLSQHRLTIEWKQEETPLRSLISTVMGLGFKLHPYSADTAQQQLELEQRKAMRRLLLAAFGTMQAMMLAAPLYLEEWVGIFIKFETYFRFAGMAITTPVVLYSARPFFVAFWRDLKTRHLTMDVPVSIAIGGAYIASVWSTFTGGHEVYFDSVCMFTFFLLIGRFLETRARLRTGEAGNQLAGVLPRSAVLVDPKSKNESTIPASQIQVGDLVRVLPGTPIPADGKVIEGRSSVDESIITGEFVPISKQNGDTVISGSLNVESPLIMEVSATGSDTQLSTVMSLLDRAAQEKPKVALIADYIAQYFVAAVLILSAVVFTSWYFVDSDKAFWITLSVLVATCPCALSLATPTALTAATGSLRKAGVLITRGHVLEGLTKSKRIIFDKTGTLTLGQLSIDQIVTTEGSEDAQLQLATSLEQHSQHPIASAFQHSQPLPMNQISVEPGEGVKGFLDEDEYRIGKPSYVSQQNVTPPSDDHWIALSKNNHVVAWFLLSDQLRPQAESACHALKALSLQVEMLSGDQSNQVPKMANKLGLSKAQGGISPDGKLAYLSSLDSRDYSIMVGDGINDVPVLAKAPLSIAIGTASDLAKTHADIILTNNQLSRLPELIEQARKTKRIIKQNLLWALLYNASVLPLAAFGLLPPWAAALGMSFSSLVVVFNALRLTRLKSGFSH